MPRPAVGVIGVGAMGLGIVRSLLRSGFEVRVRDIRHEAESAAVAAGASARDTPGAVARNCPVVILVVVDQRQVETVLFGADGAVVAMQPGAVVIACPTVAPEYTAALASRLASRGVRLLDAPMSGGPQRATDGTMTIMAAGDAATLLACEPVLAAISDKRFVVGSRPGDAARFKILNNQLAAVNLAAGAEAMALAIRAGIEPRRFLDVVNASSGASWIFGDRMARVLADDSAPRAAVNLLTKDSGIAVEAAAALGFDAPLARAAHEVFCRAVAAGFGDEDDAALLRFYLDTAARG